jgi:hypothetical protein
MVRRSPAGGHYSGRVSLSVELERIAAAAAAHADDGEEVAAVLATAPAGGRRLYLCAYASVNGEQRAWLALDAGGEPVADRLAIREAVSIAALCEVAVDVAGGGELQALREQLVALRIREAPPGIEAAEEAALALEQVVGSPPRLATPVLLDEIGAATLRLEAALGEDGPSPFAHAMRQATVVAEALAGEVERTYKRPLVAH